LVWFFYRLSPIRSPSVKRNQKSRTLDPVGLTEQIMSGPVFVIHKIPVGRIIAGKKNICQSNDAVISFPNILAKSNFFSWMESDGHLTI
jgi:hypothetical protein